jgi:CRISPR-associated RAMP protein (TIGR02581 family)
MFLNEITMGLKIEPMGPIMVKAQSEEREGGGTRNEMKFVTTGSGTQKTVYLPGSSLKGVLRSHCERIARTVGARCCNPFLINEEDLTKPDCFCGKKIESLRNANENLSVAEVYRGHSCRVCKLFGSTGIGSRLFIEDAFPDKLRSRDEIRTNVAIDRTKGSVAQGPFTMEVITRGAFTTTIHLRNFEIWQLGLLGLTLRDLNQERIRIGFAKSRGLGKVKGTLEWIELAYHGYQAAGNGMRRLNSNGEVLPLLNGSSLMVYGVGKLMGDEGACYGYVPEDEVSVPINSTVTLQDDWIRMTMRLGNYENQILPLLRQCVNLHWIPIAPIFEYNAEQISSALRTAKERYEQSSIQQGGN